jgi:hypothetical protein
MSRGMKDATGSYYSWLGFGSYVAVGETASLYKTSHKEDWAETVAAAVYPTHSRFVDPATGKPYIGTTRKDYIRTFLPNGTLFHGSRGTPGEL